MYGVWKNEDQARFNDENSTKDSDVDLSTGLAVLFCDENEVEINSSNEDNSNITLLENDFTASRVDSETVNSW
jgi:hypothetical protein